MPATALEGVEQRCLLAADIGTRAGVHDDVEIEARPEDVLAQETCRISLGDSGGDPTHGVRNLAADVDEGVVRADRIGRVDTSLDQGVRVGEHEWDVLAGTRLGLISVDHEVVRFTVVLGHEAPLHTGGEACATTTAETGLLDECDHLVGMHTEGHRNHVVTAVTAVAADGVGIGLVPVGGEDRGQRHVSGLRLRGRARGER
ncbi:unannotated protein [freshwater metagenome]|uniref:Unannotated protein n=1 Tax=freshwater metagenome TaxID=449393 RepID=A0A6J7BLI0_9ZZZZ